MFLHKMYNIKMYLTELEYILWLQLRQEKATSSINNDLKIFFPKFKTGSH